MLEDTAVTVGGEEFTIRQLRTTDALRYGVQIGKIVGTMMAGGLNGVDLDDDLDILDQLDISKLITGLLSQLDDERTPSLIRGMLRDTIVIPKWNDAWYETRFAGHLGDLTELLTVVVMQNFGEVLQIAGKKFMAARPPTPPKSSDSGVGENGGSPQEGPESTGSFFESSPPGSVP